MSDKNFFGLNETIAKNIDEMKKLKESSDNIDPTIEEAMRTIEMTSTVIDSIMSGRQIDLAYFKAFSSNAVKNIKRKKKKPI